MVVADTPVVTATGLVRRHHIHYRRNMGLTELDNLVLLCNRHHHHVHRHDLHLKLLPDGNLDITHPDGTVRTSHPAANPTGEAVAAEFWWRGAVYRVPLWHDQFISRSTPMTRSEPSRSTPTSLAGR